MKQDFMPSYQVGRDFIESNDSKWYSQIIDENGFCIVPGIQARFYCAPLVAFLLSKEVAVTVRATKRLPAWENIQNEDGTTYQILKKSKEVEVKSGFICGQDYINTYLTGYSDGANWFKEYVSDPLYQESKEKIRMLHDLYYHSNSDGLRAGIERVKYSFDFFITHGNIKEQGYRAGIIAKIDELREKYTRDFANFDECDTKKDYLEGNSINVPSIKTKSSFVEPYTDDEKKAFVLSILAPLGGINPNKQRIMIVADYDRLIQYATHLVITDSLPGDIKPIPQTAISNEHVRYTLYRLHKEVFGTRRIHDSFISFLHSVFVQFSGTLETTTKQKFASAPNSYNRDFAGYIGEEA